ncbi:hypothetical protein GCM10010844_17830 [Deinococcus radiotolerans]|uniref:Uncharacterized protein n=1 Tax=Deinococcus radiotolerans TaxID=1309407 RepID=A0ABQ2FHT8_9DEIO|nr:hypothetical protein GCM10010844_17830 [Deinococcus radiotolerans]
MPTAGRAQQALQVRLPRAVIHDVQTGEQVEGQGLVTPGHLHGGVREPLGGQLLMNVLQSGTRGGNMSEQIHDGFRFKVR